MAESNSAGTVTRIERYTPYSEPADMQLDVGPGFTGHATDVATGLTYMQQRYYDADIGRFISPDPVGPEEGFIRHFNRYNYALNNPVRYTDPDGRKSCSEVGSVSCNQLPVNSTGLGTSLSGPRTRRTGTSRTIQAEIKNNPIAYKALAELMIVEIVHKAGLDPRLATITTVSPKRDWEFSQNRDSVIQLSGLDIITMDDLEANFFHELFHINTNLINCDLKCDGYDTVEEALTSRATMRYISKYDFRLTLGTTGQRNADYYSIGAFKDGGNP